MAASRRTVACILVLALCVLSAPMGIDAKKKRQNIAAVRGHVAPAPAPAPTAAVGRTLLQDEGALPAGEQQQPAEAPAEAPAQAPSQEPAEPMEEAEAPAPSESQGGPAKPWAQCGGDSTWAGPTTCVEGTTCVQLSPTFSQCVEIAQSRAYGCSARWAQCGGADPGKSTAWSGPYCCTEGNECVTLSATYSQCKPCNAIYEQCGGTVPGTNLAWAEHGRPSCCAGSKPSSCNFVHANYYQCTPL